MKDNLNTKVPDESENPAFLVAAVIGSACSRHKPKQLGYLQWHDWAEKKQNEVKSKNNVQSVADGTFGMSFSIAYNA